MSICDHLTTSCARLSTWRLGLAPRRTAPRHRKDWRGALLRRQGLLPARVPVPDRGPMRSRSGSWVSASVADALAPNRGRGAAGVKVAGRPGVLTAGAAIGRYLLTRGRIPVERVIEGTSAEQGTITVSPDGQAGHHSIRAAPAAAPDR